MTTAPACRNPECDTGDPVRTFLDARYCGGPCEWAHKRALTEAAVARIDEVTAGAPETPSSSTLPAEQDSGDLGPVRYIATYTPDQPGPGGKLNIWRTKNGFRCMATVHLDPVADPGLNEEVALRALGWMPVTAWRECSWKRQLDVQPRPRAVLGRLVEQLPDDWRSFVVPPIAHPAGVIPPEVEQRVTGQIQTSRLAAAIADLMEEDGRELDRPGFWERAIKRVFG